MQPSLSINRLIAGTLTLSPKAVSTQNLSDLLVLGSSNVIDTTERMRTYSGSTAVASDFGTTAPEYLAARDWFNQSPQPAEIRIGKWAKTDTPAMLRGSTLSAAQQLMATWTAITTPAFAVVIDGITRSIAPVSFSAATNLNGIASLIQTAVAAVVPGVTVVWNSVYSRFEMTNSSTGVTSTFSFAQAPTATSYIAFSSNPAASGTITFNGTVVTFVTASPSGNQVLIGATLTATLSNLLTFLQASTDVNISKFTYFVSGSTLYLASATTGPGGNSLTISVTIPAVGGPLSGGAGTDISAMLGWTSTSSGAYVAPGSAAETALAATQTFDSLFGQKWYALQIPEASDADHEAVGAYIESTTNKHIYGITSSEAGILSPVSTTDIAAAMQALNLNRSMLQFSSSSMTAIASFLGRILTTDYNQNNSVITLMYKNEPGITAEDLNDQQIGALEGKNCNVFVAYNNGALIIEPGVCCSGQFVDVITGSDWLLLAMQTEIFNVQYTSPTKIPQTDDGMHVYVTHMEKILKAAVNNGLLAPGVWDSPGFGALKQGDFLDKGYYVYAPLIANQSSADRAARKSVAFQVAAKLAGATHLVDFNITVNQ